MVATTATRTRTTRIKRTTAKAVTPKAARVKATARATVRTVAKTARTKRTAVRTAWIMAPVLVGTRMARAAVSVGVIARAAKPRNARVKRERATAPRKRADLCRHRWTGGTAAVAMATASAA